MFVTNRDVAPTNNGSERALRPCAVYRKITNGFRSEWGATLYADIRSVVETARRRMIHAIDAIRFTLQGMPLATPRDLQSRDVSNYQRRLVSDRPRARPTCSWSSIGSRSSSTSSSR